ncbi:hypothetical protein ACSBR1_036804 [Camellia fascicularis]
MSFLPKISKLGWFGKAEFSGFRRKCTIHAESHSAALSISPCRDKVLEFGSGGSSVRLIEVAQGLKEGKSCIAMTLAETLMGLDAFYRRETTRFAGSALLLQVMFPTQSHVYIALITRPVTGKPYGTQPLANRSGIAGGKHGVLGAPM